MSGRARSTAAAVVLGAAALGHAVWGIACGAAFSRGWSAARRGDYAVALPLVERGARGMDRFEADWLAGEVRLGLWDALSAGERAGAKGERLLARAASDYARASTSAPGSAWPRAGLAAVFERRESAARSHRTFDLDDVSKGPEALVGLDGRAAIGWLDRALAAEPNAVPIHDQKVAVLARLGLREEARAAARRAGLSLPVLEGHTGFPGGESDRDLLLAFAQGAREGLGRTSMLPRDQHLFALAKLERRLGRSDDAAVDLRQALAIPTDDLHRAELWFWSGLVAEDLKDYKGADEAFARAATAPVFRAAAAEGRSRSAEAAGDLEGALRWTRAARASAPADAGLAQHEGRLARRLGRAEDAARAYKDAVRLLPRDPSPRRALVETYIEADEAVTARRALDEMIRAVGESDETRRLAARIDALAAHGEGR